MAQQDPSAVVIPFGKHKGATVAELLAKDPDYVQWLMAQGWLAQRFAELHAAILARGASPDDTPEHNQLQARFLDPVFRIAFLLAAGVLDQQQPTQCTDALRQSRLQTLAETEQRYQQRCDWAERYPSDYEARRLAEAAEALRKARLLAAHIPPAYLDVQVAFEHRGIDVLLQPAWMLDEDGKPLRLYVDGWPWPYAIGVELKPSLGDDYPSVMRQIRRLNCEYLVVRQYTGAGTSFDNVRAMFSANGASILTLQEIEAALPTARLIPKKD